MKQETLSRWLKGIVLGAFLCGLIVYLVIVPELGHSIVAQYPEFSHWYWPWYGFLLATFVPCVAALVIGWKIAGNIGSDRSFTGENARLLAHVTRLAAGDAAFFFAGNIALWLMNMNHPGVVLLSLLPTFIGVAISVAAACLSRLVAKAAELQRQSDLTI